MHFSSILIYDLMLVLNFLCEKNIPFYHASWIQILQYFQYSFFQEKKLNHSEGQVIFQIDGHHLQKISFISFFIVAFAKSSLNWDVPPTHLKPFIGKFRDIASPYQLFISQYLDMIIAFFIIIFHILLLAFTYRSVACRWITYQC